MNALARALLDDLDDDALTHLAARLAPFLPAATRVEDGWLDTAGAATYLGITRNALHKATAARAIPFEQASHGGKCWFRRADLDAWRSRPQDVRRVA